MIHGFFLMKNMRLNLGKNYETFKEHRPAGFQILTFKNCFY